MTGVDRKIIVMTPVRNEAWILPRFLQVTSQFADLIIILDQNSSDGSVELCKAQPKVVFLENQDTNFNEAQRQTVLIDTARKLVPGPRVLLALDADEIIAADAPGSDDWTRGMNAAPGTVLQIEKPTFHGSVDTVIRYPGGFPLGLVDDDAPHKPKWIHSVRIPMHSRSPTLRLEQVKALHYALLRPTASRSKHRMYAALENVAGTRHLLARRFTYNARKDYRQEGPMEPTPPQWIAGWEKMGIDMRTIPVESSHWQDLELLRLMAMHGHRRFWLDDIWDTDWEAARCEAQRQGIFGLPQQRITPAPSILSWALFLPDLMYGAAHRFRRQRDHARNQKYAAIPQA
jgi:glycosyltransferase involved in cell wall biosynthesis